MRKKKVIGQIDRWSWLSPAGEPAIGGADFLLEKWNLYCAFKHEFYNN